MDQKIIGSFLKELRKEKGLTQQQVADYFNVSDRTISRWENGKNMPDISLLTEISDFYNVDVRELLDGKRSEKQEKNVKDTLLHVSEYHQLNEKEKKKKNIYIKICLTIIIILSLFVVNGYMNNKDKINYEKIEKYNSEEIEKVIISDQYLSDDTKLSLINMINDNQTCDYYVVKTTCKVNNEYTCYPYFYISKTNKNINILCGNIDLNKKNFTGDFYYHLEDDNTIYYDLNGDFSNIGDTKRSEEYINIETGRVSYENTLYYTSNEYTYFHINNRIKIN